MLHGIHRTRPRPIHSRLAAKQNHTGNKDEEMAGLRNNINAIRISTDIPMCMSIQDLQEAM